MKNRLIFGVLLSLAICLKAQAQTPFHLMNYSGSLYSFVLEENPRFWHADGLMRVHTSSTKINFVFEKVAQIFWDNDIPTEITETIENRVNFAVRDGKLHISGNPSSTIYVYSLKGILCAAVQPNGDETVVVDVSNYGSGTYLVKISDFTFKFIKQ